MAHFYMNGDRKSPKLLLFSLLFFIFFCIGGIPK